MRRLSLAAEHRLGVASPRPRPHRHPAGCPDSRVRLPTRRVAGRAPSDTAASAAAPASALTGGWLGKGGTEARPGLSLARDSELQLRPGLSLARSASRRRRLPLFLVARTPPSPPPPPAAPRLARLDVPVNVRRYIKRCEARRVPRRGASSGGGGLACAGVRCVAAVSVSRRRRQLCLAAGRSRGAGKAASGGPGAGDGPAPRCATWAGRRRGAAGRRSRCAAGRL